MTTEFAAPAETNPLPGGVSGTDLPNAGGVPGASASPEDQDLSGQSDPDGEGDPDATSTPETEDVEFEGKKFALPKELKPALMFQADYTRKTQEHAEYVRQREAAFQQREQHLAVQAQVQQQHTIQYAQIASLDQQLEQYGKVNWQTAMQTDPQAAQAAWMQFQQLKEQRAGVAQSLQASEQQHVQRMQAAAQQAETRAVENVRNIVASWDKDTMAAINDVGERAYGVRKEHFAFFAANPGLLPILHDAVQYQKLKAAATKAAPPKPGASPVPSHVVPVRALPAGGRGAAAVSGPSDAQSTDAWMQRREAQLNARNSNRR